MAGEVNMTIICKCGHSVEVHNQFNCTFAFEKENECRCPLGKETVIARYWARRMSKERDEAKKILDRSDVQHYLAWWNANRND